MRRRSGWRWVLAFGLVLAQGVPAARAAAVGPGHLAPGFELVDLDGQTHRLADQRGNVVFLEFFATWCKPCIEAMPEIEKLKQRFAPRGVKFYAVHCKEGHDPAAVFRDSGATYPLLLEGTPVSTRYGVRGLPTFIIVDAEGRITFRATGFGEGAGPILAREIGEALGDPADEPKSPVVPEFDDLPPPPPPTGSSP